jgi:hypothetical protein
MAIRIAPVKVDAQKLPVVTWEEDRNLFAPGGGSPARVACFIRPDKKTGVLQFVSVGSVRHGAFEEARPWELLKSFAKSSADDLYYSAEDQARIQWLGSKIKAGAGRMLTTDGAVVMLAHFAGERPTDAMHLNCAVASPVEAAQLYDLLTRVFIAMRPDLVSEKCGGDFVWPKKGRRFVAYSPPAPAVVPEWKDRLVNATVAALFGLIGFGLYRIFWS